MTRPFWFVSVVACALALAIACGKGSPNPSSPSAVSPANANANANANADGSLLKATAPTPQSPINNTRIPDGQQVTLVVGNATTTFAPGVPLAYQFEVFNAAGARVYDSPLVPGGSGTTSHTVTGQLEGDQTYQWQARALYEGIPGPVSSRAVFIAPVNDGYIRGDELYDPLTLCEADGQVKTVGQIRGPVTCIPGVGARLETGVSYIVYELPVRLEEGEYSALVTNVETNTEGGKTKIISMASGYSDLATNEARMTVEKRGSFPTGGIAWRFRTTGGSVETVGEERVVVQFQAAQTYFWEATWRRNFFNVRINEGGFNGRNIYNGGKPYEGFYNPVPHVVFLGSGPSRSGPDHQTVPGMVIRQVWVSPNPRPAFANK